ncbi:hypothetical protein NWF34_18950 [Gordonia sp. GONU]|uniref:hypothetical protein n=1 Tax=Gordonia TaxID=2053 RepID=UPI00034BFCF6|nr:MULTISPECIES: hypothetical protein [Gordonia]MBA5846216.1 hypothetical protein [Gordonia amicalis]MCR8899024.1 hypothetical protein [Gordonia sp. GONU]MCZ0911226.1 hypothetical protein [Gordonia amicalis]MCZ4652982.1 hypothetical protein [Gordonia amicalis]MDV7102163.1 hypothetical protein [Gordonia amicalis]
MHGLAALLFPAVLMLFAMGMDKVQARIDRVSVSNDDVDEFIDRTGSQNAGKPPRDPAPAALHELRPHRFPGHEPATADHAASPQRAS